MLKKAIEFWQSITIKKGKEGHISDIPKAHPFPVPARHECKYYSQCFSKKCCRNNNG